MVVFGQSGCNRAIVAVFGQKWLYLGKIFCIRANWLKSGKSDSVLGKLFFTGKVGVFGQKWLYSGTSGFIREK